MVIPVAGRVFDEASGRGLGGVLVSNGELVTRTGDDGDYALEIALDAHRFITVTTPRGYRPARAFYGRTPDVVAAHLGSSSSPATLDFPLLPAPERGRDGVTIAHISDTHVVVDADRKRPEVRQPAPVPAGDEGAALRWKLFHAPERDLPTRDVLAGDLRLVAGFCAPDFVVATGDLTNAGTLAQLRAYREAIDGTAVPVYSVFGGHDGNEERADGGGPGSEPAISYTQHYEAVLGPAWYSFDWGPWHFVAYPEEDHFFTRADRERKARWLQADLAQQPTGRPVALLLHRSPGPALLATLRPFDVRLALYGHAHCSRIRVLGEMLAAEAPPLCIGGIDTRPRGFRLVRLTPDTINTHLVALPGAAGPSPALEAGPLAPHGADPALPSAAASPAPAPTQSAPQSAGPEGHTARPFRLRWQVRVPGGLHRAAPVPRDDVILVSQSDEGFPGESGVTCLEAETGRPRWYVRTDSGIKNAVAMAERATGGPAARCFAVSVAGRLYAIDAADGTLVWHADVPGYPHGAVKTSPGFDGERVFVSWGSGVAAFDGASGARLWDVALRRGTERTFAGPLCLGPLLILPVARWGLIAIRGADGAIAWERQLPLEYYCAGPLAVGETLLVAGTDGRLVRQHAGTGETLWDCPGLAGECVTGLSVAAGRVYAATTAGEVRCHDLRTGNLVWRFQTGPDLLDMTPYRRGRASLLASPVALDGHVLAGACDGWLYVLDAENGQCVSRSHVGSPITAPLVPAAGGACVGTYDGRLSLFVRG
jgi:outer membrane protein assembly factor BamB